MPRFSDPMLNISFLKKKGILCFLEDTSLDAASVRQQEHYDRIHENYTHALQLPQTLEYTKYMDTKLLKVLGSKNLGNVAEICCGEGEAFKLIGHQITHGYGVDISFKMLEKAQILHKDKKVTFLHADALNCPFKDNSFDHVIMLGGIHHVNNRERLFQEVYRILKPGGRFIFREPASDWFVWELIRKIIYKFSPGLDHETERPLKKEETIPILEVAGFKKIHYENYTFLGFCLFMNADILFFNKFFKYIPFIRQIVKGVARFDDFILKPSFMKSLGLQVIGSGTK